MPPRTPNTRTRTPAGTQLTERQRRRVFRVVRRGEAVGPVEIAEQGCDAAAAPDRGRRRRLDVAATLSVASAGRLVAASPDPAGSPSPPRVLRPRSSASRVPRPSRSSGRAAAGPPGRRRRPARGARGRRSINGLAVEVVEGDAVGEVRHDVRRPARRAPRPGSVTPSRVLGTRCPPSIAVPASLHAQGVAVQAPAADEARGRRARPRLRGPPAVAARSGASATRAGCAVPRVTSRTVARRTLKGSLPMPSTISGLLGPPRDARLATDMKRRANDRRAWLARRHLGRRATSTCRGAVLDRRSRPGPVRPLKAFAPEQRDVLDVPHR